MRTFSILALALAMTPALALADGVGDPQIIDPPAPVIAAPAAAPDRADWSGAYGGLSFGTIGGDLGITPGAQFEFEDGTTLGLFGGYMFQSGHWVYGGELAFASVQDAWVSGFVDLAGLGDQMVDLKGRVGYATGDLLIYGVLGYSMGSYDETAAGGQDWDSDGINYGIGLDYQVSDRVTVGVEYLIRDLEGDISGAPASTANTDLDSLSLRAGFNF